MQGDDPVTQCKPRTSIFKATANLDAEAATVLVRGLPFRKVVHVYYVGADQNMYCLDCGRNIIHTAVGDGAFQIGERQPRANEIVCRDFTKSQKR